jgi:hypothetical protein
MTCSPRSQKMLRLLAGFCVLSLPTAVAAQNVNSMINMFGGMMRAAVIENAETEWRKVRRCFRRSHPG